MKNETKPIVSVSKWKPKSKLVIPEQKQKLKPPEFDSILF